MFLRISKKKKIIKKKIFHLTEYMAEDALINSHFKDCIFALLADYPNNHNKRAHYFHHN